MVIELVMLLMLVLCILFIGIVGYILLDVKKELKQLKQIKIQQNKETVFISEEFLNNKKEHENINQQLKLIHETMLSFINQLSLIGKYMKSSYEYLVLMDGDSCSRSEDLRELVEDEMHLVINEIRQLKEVEKDE